MTRELRAAVVGAGAIGARLDAPGVTRPLTHAGGIRAAGLNLAALVDTAGDIEALATKWKCVGYRDFDEMMRTEKPDVVVLSVPTEARAGLLQKVAVYRPQIVIAEKPLTPSVEQSQQVTQNFGRARIPLLVNYSRRYLPVWRKLIGCNALSATIRYAKGVRHNGTHALDLCRMLFGECKTAKALVRRNDFWPEDPTVSAFLRFERCPEVFLQGLDESQFTLFEVDIIGADWRVIVDRDGQRVRRFAVKDDNGIPPGRRLVEVAEEEASAESAATNLMRHSRDVVGGAVPWCTGEDAVAAERIAECLLTL